MLRQQHLPGENKGVLYVGTHGRGIFKSSNTSSIFDLTYENKDILDMVSIYPNPAESFINLEFSSDIDIYDVTIVDLWVKKFIISNSLISTKIDISSFEEGSYIVVVNSNNGKQLGKFVKTK